MNTWLAFAHCWVGWVDVFLFYFHTDILAGLVKKLSFVFMEAKGHGTTCPNWLSGWWGGWALPLTRAVCASLGERIVELLLGEEMHLMASAWKNVCILSFEQTAFYVFSSEFSRVVIPVDCIFTSTDELLTITDSEPLRMYSSCSSRSAKWGLPSLSSVGIPPLLKPRFCSRHCALL